MPNPKTIIFCGTPEFAVPSLEALAADSEFKIELVITQPDKPVGRKQIVTPPPVKVCAEKLGIEVYQTEDINNHDSDSGFRIPKFDVLITVAYGQILKQPILNLPKIAPINIHPSLLPKLRGASPIQNAILSGDNETGTTIQIMTEKLDAGDIVGQVVTDIAERETATSLHDRLAELSASLLIKTLKKPLSPAPQNESEATFCKKLSREDGQVDTKTMLAEEIDRKVRALVPWPGVTCNVEGQELKIIETSLIETDNSVEVQCADNSKLFLITVQPPGKKEMTAKEWGRGIRG
ncbi:methionyl-tRNA formyltransferase [Patescibacteria group bacterium]|nr:methionyl-tRNA formyltransferase [Patescibacteria group bacterium]MBU1911774.1 methionyl-tRNA formyltransferase [Patescibacteria group bacterium]